VYVYLGARAESLLIEQRRQNRRPEPALVSDQTETR